MKIVMRMMRFCVLAVCAVSVTPALALDPLRIERDFSLINLAEFIRYVDGDAVFSLQNPRDEVLTVEIERYPIHWPLESYLNISKSPIRALRLFATDGRELAADWRAPHLLTITQSPQSVQTYAFDGRPGPLWHIWMWGEGQREAYLRNARSFWVIAIGLSALVCLLAMIRLVVWRQLSGRRVVGLAMSLGITSALLKYDQLIFGTKLTSMWADLPMHSDDVILAFFILNFGLFVAAHFSAYVRRGPWRSFWRTGLWLATLAFGAGLAIWASAILYGPMLGFITADLLALLWLVAGSICATTVLLSPNLLSPNGDSRGTA